MTDYPTGSEPSSLEEALAESKERRKRQIAAVRRRRAINNERFNRERGK